MVTIVDLNPHLRTINRRTDEVVQPQAEKRKRPKPKLKDKK